MKIIKEAIDSYYLIEIVRVDNNKLLRSWKAFDEEEAWNLYEQAKVSAREESDFYETLIELSITLMGNSEEELASELFDFDSEEDLIEMVALTEDILNEKLNLS